MDQQKVDYEDPWAAPIKQEPDLPADELSRWRAQRERSILKAGQYGWTKSEFARRSGISQGTLWPLFDGSYKGVFKTQIDKLEKFLDSIEELSAASARVPVPPGFISTPTAQQVIDALMYAQTMPEIAVIVLAAGMGKSMALDYYGGARPHVYKITMRPSTTTAYKMMADLGDLFNLNDFDRSPTRIDKAVGERLRRNGKSTLLMVDEAQHLKDEAINQLRYFYDIYGVGIALVGNEELYGRFGEGPKPAYAQLQSRFGLKVRRMTPQPGDIAALIAAWGIEDPATKRLAEVIGRKPGTLRQLTKTLQLAGMFAAGEGRDMTVEDLKLAAQNRDLEH